MLKGHSERYASAHLSPFLSATFSTLMRVIHILDTLNRGGAEILALDVCRNAKSNNLDLTFVATGGGELEDDFRNSEAHFIRLQREAPVDLRLAAQLRSIIKERKIQIVHSHQAVEALHAYLATFGLNTKQVLSFHGADFDLKNRLALKFLVPRMHANIVVSRGLLSWLETETRLGTKSNFNVVYNGVDARRLQHTRAGLRDELRLSDNNLLIGMIGNFYNNAAKDQLTVCKALPELFSLSPHVHCAFIGECLERVPGLYQECVNYCSEHNIAERVHFVGKRVNISEVLSSLDVFVFSSLRDTFGIAVVEAMMMNLPTIVSDIEPLLEVSADGDCASVFRAKDPSDLTRKLTRLINDPYYRSNLGKRGKQRALECFSIEAHILSLTDTYRSLLCAPATEKSDGFQQTTAALTSHNSESD